MTDKTRTEQEEKLTGELVEHPYDEERKVFTDAGLRKLIELLTVGDLQVWFQGESIVLRAFDDKHTLGDILKVKFANVISASVDQIEQLSSEDPHMARCELYGLAGLLKEAAKFVERAAQEIDEHKWDDSYVPHFIPIGEEYSDWYMSRDGEEEEEDEPVKEEK